MDNFLDIMKEYVLVTRAEYEKSITNNKLVEDVTKDGQTFIEMYNQLYKSIADDFSNDLYGLLDVFFNSQRMGSDSRSEQVDLDGMYSGFSKKARKYLNSKGVTDEILIEYINKKWDEYENREDK